MSYAERNRTQRWRRQPRVGQIFLGLALVLLSLTATAEELEFSNLPALHTSAVGYAGSQSDIHKCFREVLDKGESGRDTFRKNLKSGSPASRLYSAIGLCKVDYREGRKALNSLLEDESKVELLQGCTASTHAVKEVAAALLAEDTEGMNLSDF